MFENEFSIKQVQDRILQDKSAMAMLDENSDSYNPEAFRQHTANTYKQFGYNEDGTPMPTAKRLVRSGARAVGMNEDMAEAAAATPIPMLTTLGGTAIGAMGGPIGAAGGASIGSLLGEELNAAVGLTDPLTANQKALALGAPLVGPLAARTAPFLGKALRRLPGGSAGVVDYMNEQFQKSVQGLRIQPEDVLPVKESLKQAKNVKINAQDLKALIFNEAKDVGKRDLTSVQTQNLSPRAVQQAKAEAEAAGTEFIPPTKESGYFQRLTKVQRALPDLMKEGKIDSKLLLQVNDDLEEYAVKYPDEKWGKIQDEIGKAIRNAEFDATLTPQGRAKAGELAKIYDSHQTLVKKAGADEVMSEAFQHKPGGVFSPVAGDETLTQFNKTAFDKFLSDPKITRAFSPSEIAEMRGAVENVGYFKNPMTRNPLSKEGMNIFSRYGPGGTIGSMGALALGRDPVLGALGGAAIEEVMRQGLSSSKGRALMKYMAKEGRGYINVVELNQALGQLLGTASAGYQASKVPGVTGAGQQ